MRQKETGDRWLRVEVRILLNEKERKDFINKRTISVNWKPNQLNTHEQLWSKSHWSCILGWENSWIGHHFLLQTLPLLPPQFHVRSNHRPGAESVKHRCTCRIQQSVRGVLSNQHASSKITVLDKRKYDIHVLSVTISLIGSKDGPIATQHASELSSFRKGIK